MANRLSAVRAAAAIGLSLQALACAQSPTGDTSQTSASFGPTLSQESAPNRRIAVAHRFSLRLPSVELEAVQQRHLDECIKLGCTVLNTSIDRSNQMLYRGSASVRLPPAAYETFAKVLAAPPATVFSHAQSAEDLTLPVMDAEKRLEVKSALRDRLAAMLRDPGPKSAADLASIEKEIAQIQTEIESIVAQRDALRARTDTLRIDISYVGTTAQVRGFDLSPIHNAVRDIGRTLIASVGYLIWFLAALVPWIPVIAVVWWAIRRIRRRRAAKAQS
jgi:uncharacterized protein DUF4349